jgi:hypothetical protein
MQQAVAAGAMQHHSPEQQLQQQLPPLPRKRKHLFAWSLPIRSRLTTDYRSQTPVGTGAAAGVVSRVA